MFKNNMPYQHAIRRLAKIYDEALHSDRIEKPLAYALYHTWKWYDQHEKKRKLNETQMTDGWIPVSEGLPKTIGVYRVTRYYPNNVMNPRYIVDACCFDGSNTWYNDNRINHERDYADNVIAWQENPEPYKIKREE
jgi:hypothetical protein